jgi:hypothetical protein
MFYSYRGTQVNPPCAAVTALSSHAEGDVTTVSADDCEECKKTT